MQLSDRDRMLLAFANLASHGIAARPAMASDAAGLAAELGARQSPDALIARGAMGHGLRLRSLSYPGGKNAAHDSHRLGLRHPPLVSRPSDGARRLSVP
jgi:hypothetical protein